MLYRHGDVLIEKVRSIPKTAEKQKHVTLALGEVTGHSHRIRQANAADLFRTHDKLFLRIKSKSATLVHEEHAEIELPKGSYRVWRQREYTPQRIITVRD